MRELHVQVSEAGELVLPESNFAGYDGEHLASKLLIHLPPSLLAAGASYFRLQFTTGLQNTFKSDMLYPEDGQLHFELPAHVMVWGKLEVQITAYDMSGEALHHLIKSNIFSLEVGESLGHTDQVLFPDSGAWNESQIFQPLSQKGEKGGYASLDQNGRVPLAQLPEDWETATGTSGEPLRFSVGAVSTLPAGNNARVVNSGAGAHVVLDFGIPRGEKGEKGDPAVENLSKTKAVIAKMQQKQPVKIVCYGDSMTYGYTIGSGAQVANPYPKVLQQNLRELYLNENITVINAGHCGWRTNEALAGISEVIHHAPDLCLFMFGIHDMKGSSTGGSPITLQQYQENTEAIINALLAQNIVPVVMTPTPVNLSSIAADYQVGQDIAKEVVILERLTRQYGLCLIHTYKAIQTLFNHCWVDPLTFSSDGMHFSPEGYPYLAHIVLKDLCGIREVASGDYIASTINNEDMVLDLALVGSNVHTGYKAQAFYNNILLCTANSSGANRNGTAVKLFVYNHIKGMKARLHYPKSPSGDTGASTGFRNNGVFYPTDFYSPVNFADGYTDIPLDFGLNQIEMRATDCSQTGTGNFSKSLFWGGTVFFREGDVGAQGPPGQGWKYVKVASEAAALALSTAGDFTIYGW